METYIFNSPQYGTLVAIPEAIPHDSEWVTVQVYQHDNREFTSRGIISVPPSALDGSITNPLGKLAYVSNDVWAKDREAKVHKSPPVGFPPRLSVSQYKTPHLMVFVKVWQSNHSFVMIANELGISQRKLTSLASRLRSLGVKLPEKQDEVFVAPKKQIDWMHFVKVVKGAKYIETCVNALDMSLDKFLFHCVFLQDQGVKLVIPAFLDQPDWIIIRQKEDLKTKIHIKPVHGSGRNFKQRWANYKRKPPKFDRAWLASLNRADIG